MKENRFNLIDEPWIPVVGKGKVGLRQIFADESIVALGGNPVEKIAVFKLLLAIAQSAITPKDETEWKFLGVNGLQKRVSDYFDKYYDCFWLYGEKPFLQMPAIKKADVKSFGTVEMHVATGNTTVVTQIQTEKKDYSDAEKALLVLKLMGFAFGGKKTDNSVVLSKGYVGKSNEKGKPASGKPGPSLGFMGFLHSFFLVKSVIESVYLNLFTQETECLKHHLKGFGQAPWELMPNGEDDEIAKALKDSYIGRLVPLNRFVLLEENGMHYSEGITHSGYIDGVVDPSVTVDFSGSKPKVIWTDPEKRPWRQLTSLLAFIDSNGKNSFECFQLKSVYGRLIEKNSFSVWSGGVRVSSNAGEQYLTGTDDFVESETQLSSSVFTESTIFFSNLSKQMSDLDSISKSVYAAISRYYADLMVDGKDFAAKASNQYWQQCESVFQRIVDTCSIENTDQYNLKMDKINNQIWQFVKQIYNQYCPNQSARQLEAWAKNFPKKFEKKRLS
ncbi:MAG: type I-E CRISPR-associated protein Cse1/CasA [Fibrobacter sp.]|nr:type I-E CRISPR-associated protein Cse1/CasA [Fibrobacter sp.]